MAQKNGESDKFLAMALCILTVATHVLIGPAAPALRPLAQPMRASGLQAIAIQPTSMPKDQSSLLTVRSEPWSSPPGGGTRCTYLVAEEQGAMIGGCGVEVIAMSHDGLVNCERMKPRAVVSGTLHVDPRYRRQGIAQRILREAEGKARSWGCSEMMLLVKRKNEPALKLYSKMGYEQLPWTPDHGGEVCMRRRLFWPDLHTLKSIMPQFTRISRSKYQSNSYRR